MRLLIVEDSPDDFHLISLTLQQQGISADCRQVDTPEGLQAALDEGGWDALLLDYHVPGMNVEDTLEQVRRYAPDTPAMLVSGAIRGDDAPNLLRQRASDLVLKNDLSRLGPTLERCLREGAEQRARREAERSLQAKEELTFSVMESLPSSIAVLDEEGTILRVNHCWREFGLQNGLIGDSVGTNYFDACVQDPDMGSQALAGMRRVLAGDLPEFALEYPCDSATERRWFLLQVSRLGGTRRGLVSSHLDITARKLAEEALAETNTRYRLFFENLLDGYAHCHMIFADDTPTDFEFRAVNPAFTRLTGLENVEGRRVSDILPAFLTDNRDVMERFGNVALTGAPAQFETYVKSLERWFLVSAFRPATGDFAIVFENTTEAKRRERELQERRNDMEFLQQQQVAAQTAAAIAHELNQPLGAISAYNEVALRVLQGGGPEKLVRAIEGSAEQAQRAGRTLHELLAFLQHQEIQTEPMDLNAVVKEAIAMAQNDGYGGFHPVLRLKRGLPPVRANRTQLQKVMVNLVRNGVEAMREAGVPDAAISITVRTLAESRQAQVTVKDSGPGVDTETARRIFDPFFTTKARGIGLGLAISRALVEAHGGQLWHEPGDKPGATFHFTLPFAED